MEISNSLLSFWRAPVAAALALCCLLTGGTVLISHFLPAADDDSFIALNSCALPCVFGVTPGTTTREHIPETYARIPMSYLTYGATQQTYAFRQNKRLSSLLMLITFAGEGDSTVHSAQLYRTSSTPVLGTLSDFLLAGYHPTRVFTGCQNVQQFVIALGDQPLFVQVALGRTFQPDAPVMLVGASSDDAAMDRTLFAFGCTLDREWIGFAPLWKYLSVE